MAMSKCKECGKAVSTLAKTCPNCGVPKPTKELKKSNMSKLGEDGKPIYNEAGKVMKGPNYFKPDLSKFLK